MYFRVGSIFAVTNCHAKRGTFHSKSFVHWLYQAVGCSSQLDLHIECILSLPLKSQGLNKQWDLTRRMDKYNLIIDSHEPHSNFSCLCAVAEFTRGSLSLKKQALSDRIKEEAYLEMHVMIEDRRTHETKHSIKYVGYVVHPSSSSVKFWLRNSSASLPSLEIVPLYAGFCCHELLALCVSKDMLWRSSCQILITSFISIYHLWLESYCHSQRLSQWL